jgi:hypothetical protein
MDAMTAFILWALLTSPGAAQEAVRFHHVHYRVGDPSAAMNHVAAKVDGARVMLPGLGVGVRAGGEFLLFDRLDPSDKPAITQLPVTDAYRAAVAWLRNHGVTASPETAASLHISADLVHEIYDHLAFVAADLNAVRGQLARAGATPARSNEDSLLFSADDGLMVEIVRDADRPDAFWCPMHPDVRSADRTNCHLCRMELVPIPPPKLGEYKLEVTQLRKGRAPGLSGLKLSITEPDSNETVKSFRTVHERILHLFIVGRDLEYFEHVHPEVASDGSFILTHTIPPGEYMVIADFLPVGGTTQMVQRALIVGGKPAPAERAIVPEDVRVTLKSEDFVAGKYACLTFSVADGRTGAPVTDLEPYLGAPAHMLLVRSDLADAVHAHPEELATGGPAISFHPLVPGPGDYKVWVQIQRGGRVFTFPFSLRAER